MSQEEAVLRYKTAMSVFKNWFSEGVISEEELSQIDKIMAAKCGLSLCSIYREDDLLLKENRANIR